MMSSSTSCSTKGLKFPKKRSLSRVTKGTRRSSSRRTRSRTYERFLICLIRKRAAEFSLRILKRLWALCKGTLQKF